MQTINFPGDINASLDALLGQNPSIDAATFTNPEGNLRSNQDRGCLQNSGLCNSVTYARLQMRNTVILARDWLLAYIVRPALITEVLRDPNGFTVQTLSRSQKQTRAVVVINHDMYERSLANCWTLR